MNEIALIGAVVGVVQGLIELIKFLVGKAVGNKQELQINHIKSHIDHLYDQHNKYDLDGTPIWYVPRSWATTQDKIVKLQVGMSNTQKEMSSVLEKTVKILDKMERRQEIYFQTQDKDSSDKGMRYE